MAIKNEAEDDLQPTDLSLTFAEKVQSKTYTVAGIVLIWPLFALVLNAFNVNIGSTVYFALKPMKESALKEFIAVVVDASVFLFVPLAITLIMSSVALSGLINRQNRRERDEIARGEKLQEVLLKQINEHEDAISKVVQQHVALGMKELTGHADQHIARVGTHVDSAISAWSQVSHDERMRSELTRLTDVIGKSDLSRDPSHRIVLHSLVEGMINRLSVLLENIEERGAFMEPDERRRLTEELCAETSSYHVILVGARSPLRGAWKWHPPYLHFLVDAANRYPNGVSWTFIMSNDESTEKLAEAVSDVLGLGLKCYTFGKEQKGDIPWMSFETFFSRGPLIELFGRTGLPGSKLPTLTWKATALYKQTSGGRREPVRRAILDSWVENEGVWSKDDILKLVRVGGVDPNIHQKASTRQILDTILQYRVEARQS